LFRLDASWLVFIEAENYFFKAVEVFILCLALLERTCCADNRDNRITTTKKKPSGGGVEGTLTDCNCASSLREKMLAK
jgi:hypothetical protein